MCPGDVSLRSDVPEIITLPASMVWNSGVSHWTETDQALNISAKSGIEFRKIARCDLGTIADRLQCGGKIGDQRRNGLFLLANLRLRMFLPTEKPGCRPNFSNSRCVS
jgi:hypothetical protein